MQNQKTLQQMIREYEMNMPPEILNLVKTFDWKKEIRMIVNQNQLMLDIGADLEESVYLLILGIIDIGDLFERLVEVHELPEDKVQKILTEVEKQIFEPMHHKLAELDGEDAPMEQTKPKEISKLVLDQNNTQTVKQEPKDISREDILSEIEKDPPVLVKKDPPKIVINIPQNQTRSFQEESQDTIDVRKPVFQAPVATQTPLRVPAPSEAIIEPITPSEPSPVSALTQPTVSQIPPPPPPPATKYTADPYREPIE